MLHKWEAVAGAWCCYRSNSNGKSEEEEEERRVCCQKRRQTSSLSDDGDVRSVDVSIVEQGIVKLLHPVLLKNLLSPFACSAILPAMQPRI